MTYKQINRYWTALICCPSSEVKDHLKGHKEFGVAQSIAIAGGATKEGFEHPVVVVFDDDWSDFEMPEWCEKIYAFGDANVDMTVSSWEWKFMQQCGDDIECCLAWASPLDLDNVIETEYSDEYSVSFEDARSLAEAD